MKPTVSPLRLAHHCGVLVLPDTRYRSHEFRVAHWLERCTAEARWFVLVRPVGSRRSILEVRCPAGAPDLPERWRADVVERWRDTGAAGLGATAGPRSARVRLPHADAITAALELVGGQGPVSFPRPLPEDRCGGVAL